MAELHALVHHQKRAGHLQHRRLVVSVLVGSRSSSGPKAPSTLVIFIFFSLLSFWPDVGFALTCMST